MFDSARHFSMLNDAPMQFSAALLAGGESSRMGSDKAGVRFEGKPLWRRQMATLLEINAGELLVSCRPESAYFQSEKGIVRIHDSLPGLGPLGGLAAILQNARFEFVLILAIDLPRITAQFLSLLIAEASRLGKGIVPRDGQWFEPLAAIYPKACLPIISERLRGPDRSMQHFVKAALGQGLVAEYPIGKLERLLFKNLNAKADLS